MRFQRCNNSACARPFQVNEFRIKRNQGGGEIICPHCGHREPGVGDSVFLSHAMLPEQEAQFEENNPRPTPDAAA